ncbi:hypothetical protein D3C84_1269010 [compost metagenome]
MFPILVIEPLRAVPESLASRYQWHAAANVYVVGLTQISEGVVDGIEATAFVATLGAASA